GNGAYPLVAFVQVDFHLVALEAVPFDFLTGALAPDKTLAVRAGNFLSRRNGETAVGFVHDRGVRSRLDPDLVAAPLRQARNRPGILSVIRGRKGDRLDLFRVAEELDFYLTRPVLRSHAAPFDADPLSRSQKGFLVVRILHDQVGRSNIVNAQD